MKNIIGTFAKADWRGKEVFGVVISTHKVCGDEKVGFAFGEPTQWVAFLTNPESITEVEEPSDVVKAIESARLYWTYELKSLRQRAALHFDIDDEKELARLIENAKLWLARLK